MTAISRPERLALQQSMQMPQALHRPLPRPVPQLHAVLDPPADAARWRRALQPLLPQWRLVEPQDSDALARCEVLLTQRPVPGLLAALPSLRLIQVLGGTSDAVLSARLPAGAHIARSCAAHLTRQTAEYVLATVLHYHRGMDVYAAQQRQRQWQALPVRMADERRIGIMGLGQLGSCVAQQLAALGFRVRGWSRSEHTIGGVATFHGSAGLEAFLRATEILVCLLPLTTLTQGLLARPVFDALPPGARLVHVGHSTQWVQADLLAALADGRLAHATLDNLDLADGGAAAHPLWDHPRVTLTPGVAALLRPEAGATSVARNLQRWARNETLMHVVDRQRGY